MEPVRDSKERPVNRLVRDRRRRQASSPEEHIRWGPSNLFPEITAQATENDLVETCYMQPIFSEMKKQAPDRCCGFAAPFIRFSSLIYSVCTRVWVLHCTVGGDECVAVHVGHQISGILHKHAGLLWNTNITDVWDNWQDRMFKTVNGATMIVGECSGGRSQVNVGGAEALNCTFMNV